MRLESGSGLGPMADSCKLGNEPSGSIKGGNMTEIFVAFQEGFCSMELIS
jgi:hypothetical protein